MNIQNFIFFDTETTGLPYQEHNKTKIVELTLVAVESNHISLGVFPRVQNKLTLCFNPEKFINPEATKITGINNDLLESQSTFNEKTCTIINDFLSLQKKPICLVAHNGNNFDYPILKAEFCKAGCELIDDILCIDSLQTFRDLNINEPKKANDSLIVENEATITSIPNEISIYDLPTQKIPTEFCDGFDEILYNAVENIENSHYNKTEIQNINENTPKKNYSVVDGIINEINKEQEKLYYMPSSSSNARKDAMESGCSNNSLQSPVKTSSVRKKLYFGKNTYRLIDVYKKLTNKVNDGAHMAEQDVNMLIECAATLGQDFVDWANANAKKLSNIPVMTPGKKIGT